MEILTSSQMKKVDEETIDKFYPGLELMERAGRKVSEFIMDTFGGGRLKAVIFAGAGNNGGDAMVVARYLVEAGCECSIHLLKGSEHFAMDTLKNYERLGKLKSGKRRLREFDSNRPDWMRQVEKDLGDATVIVDGLFGTGVKGALHGRAAEMVRVINGANIPVVSIDIPSGVDGDSGAATGPTVQADYTITIGKPKLGLLFHPGKSHCGEIVVADIGFPEEVVKKHWSGLILLDVDEAAARAPRRPPDAHKYNCGALLLVSGSRSYTGAAILAGESALRGGCGMVFLGVPEGVRMVVEAQARECVTFPLPETDAGTVAESALEAIEPYFEKADALAVGPGLGRNEETDRFIRRLVGKSPVPVVLDADGITAFSGKASDLGRAVSPVVVTPHSGELKKLVGEEIHRTPLERIEQTRRLAAELGVTLLHKGAPSIMASPDGAALVSLHGTSALATGGAGDVLTGLVGSFLAQGAGALDAAAVGCFLLSRAGEIASVDMGLRGVIAGDLPPYVGPAMIELEEAIPRRDDT